MNKKLKRQDEREVSREEALKAVYEYAAWRALFQSIRIYIFKFTRFISHIIHSLLR